MSDDDKPCPNCGKRHRNLNAPEKEEEYTRLSAPYIKRVVDLMAVLYTEAESKGIKCTLGHMQEVLTIAGALLSAMHVKDKAEYAECLENWSRAVHSAGEENEIELPYADKQAEAIKIWLERGQKVYKDLETSRMLRKFAKAIFSAGDEPEPTKH